MAVAAEPAGAHTRDSEAESLDVGLLGKYPYPNFNAFFLKRGRVRHFKGSGGKFRTNMRLKARFETAQSLNFGLRVVSWSLLLASLVRQDSHRTS
jgi:hypothetical protein